MPLHTCSLRYQDGETKLTGFFACDDSLPAPPPGILVIHGGAGLDKHAQGRAEWLAGLGYAAFACDMYGDSIAGDRQRVVTHINELRGDREKLCCRARAGMDAMASLLRIDRPVTAVGYCFGGMCALEMARAGVELAAVVSVHGGLDTRERAEPGRVMPKILVCHGALDPHIPMNQVNSFAEEMNHAGTNWQLIIYGGALHGFTHEAGPFLPGVAYSPQADARSRAAIRDFLAEVYA
ncbi:MAG TPA: dienelactone hydrolase family protein [Candidatus Acidoferrum sp.]|nr:dienelactone hydrolase family protein [Candidatus Acidoferrum sp.]